MRSITFYMEKVRYLLCLIFYVLETYTVNNFLFQPCSIACIKIKINDLYIFPLIFTHNNLYCQVMSPLQIPNIDMFCSIWTSHYFLFEMILFSCEKSILAEKKKSTTPCYVFFEEHIFYSIILSGIYKFCELLVHVYYI